MKPCIGMPVVHYLGGDVNPTPALVMAVGTEVLSLVVFIPESIGVQYVEGVPHVSSDRADMAYAQEIGCWDYIDASKPTTKQAKTAVA